jgi:hypothetical protein
MKNSNVFDTETLLLLGLIAALVIGLLLMRRQGNKRHK